MLNIRTESGEEWIGIGIEECSMLIMEWKAILGIMWIIEDSIMGRIIITKMEFEMWIIIILIGIDFTIIKILLILLM